MNTRTSIKLSTVIMACGTLLMGCNVNPALYPSANRVVGSGQSATESRTVSDFDAITVAGSGVLTVVYGPAESLTISADDNILPYLTSDVRNGRLVLGSKPNVSLSPRSAIAYRLTVKSLNDVEVSGNASAGVAGVSGNRFKVSIPGSGEVRLAGAVESQDVTISGSGSYNGERLDSRKATVTISGSGYVLVNASDELATNISGSGRVEYIGNPAKLTRNVTGSGTVKQR